MVLGIVGDDGHIVVDVDRVSHHILCHLHAADGVGDDVDGVVIYGDVCPIVCIAYWKAWSLNLYACNMCSLSFTYI